VGPIDQVFWAGLLGELVRLQNDFNTAQGRPRMRFMLLGLVVLAWLACPKAANASCGYYVVIGRPSPEAAAEQARMRHEQMPLEHKKTPCSGPQCRQQNRPMTPAPGVPVTLQDPMAVTLAARTDCEREVQFASLDESSFISDPHIWRSDPPPRF
jgi:hypothetical protein